MAGDPTGHGPAEPGPEGREFWFGDEPEPGSTPSPVDDHAPTEIIRAVHALRDGAAPLDVPGAPPVRGIASIQNPESSPVVPAAWSPPPPVPELGSSTGTIYYGKSYLGQAAARHRAAEVESSTPPFWTPTRLAIAIGAAGLAGGAIAATIYEILNR